MVACGVLMRMLKDANGSSEPEHEEEAKSRHILYIQKLKSHHDTCEKRYEAAQAERQKEERKRTLVLHRQQDTAPDREALGLVSEESSFEFSEDDYVPECGVTTSDSSLDVKLERKRKVQKTHSDQKVSVLLKKTHLLPAKESGPSSTDDSVTVMTCQDSDDAAHVKRQKKTKEIAQDSDQSDLDEDDDQMAASTSFSTPSTPSPSSRPSSSTPSSSSRTSSSTPSSSSRPSSPTPSPPSSPSSSCRYCCCCRVKT
ncbi:hypothetical protein ABVT39_019418 [Epinephelus coioides]